MAERQFGTSVEVRNLVLAAQFDAGLNRIPKRCRMQCRIKNVVRHVRVKDEGLDRGSSRGIRHHGGKQLVGLSLHT